MKCFDHLEAPAIGVCFHCGKGVCTSCVYAMTQQSIPRLACSLDCQNQHRKQRTFRTSQVLFCISLLWVVLSVYLFKKQSELLGLLTLLYGLFCLFITGIFRSDDDCFPDDAFKPFFQFHEEIRWRAGLALRAAHEFRAELAQTLGYYGRLTQERVNLDQFEAADEPQRIEILQRVYQVSKPESETKPADLQASVDRLVQQVQFTSKLGYTFFEDLEWHQEDLTKRRERLEFLKNAAYRLNSKWNLESMNRQLMDSFQNAASLDSLR